MTRKKGNDMVQVIGLLFALSLVFAGCSKKSEAPPVSHAPQQAKPQIPVMKQQSSAHLTPSSGLLLDFSGKKDPFKPYAIEAASAKPAGGVKFRLGKERDVLPIQSYEVNRFKISGIIIGMRENTALVIDPAGKGYVVHEGMLIGSNGGRIQRIAPTYLEVIETYREENGKLVKKTTRLTLQQKK